MGNENTKQFEFIPVEFTKENYKLIEEMYRLHKDQARKIFDLACGISSDEDIMGYVEYLIIKEDSVVRLALDGDVVSACIILDDICIVDDVIARCDCHIVVGRKYWGKQSRELIQQCLDYLEEELLPIKRFEARVPSNNFGVIKLLKDVGFRVEGTCYDCLVFNNKEGKPKFYNELVFGKVNKEIKLNV